MNFLFSGGSICLFFTFYSFVADVPISCFCVFQLDNEDSDEEFEDDEYGIGLPM